MHIESFSSRRLRLKLDSVPLELWIYLDPGHEPVAMWLHSETDDVLAVVPVAGDDRRMSDQVRHRGPAR